GGGHDVAEHGSEAPGEDGRPDQAEQPPEHGEDHRLHQELAQDVAAARAQGLAHADLADAFGDRHQHDVHDHDAAHDEADARDHDRHHVDAAGGVLPQLVFERYRDHREVVGLVEAE